jgi:hypothetical protein
MQSVPPPPPAPVVAPAPVPAEGAPADALSLLAARAAPAEFGAKDSWRLNVEGEWIGDFEDANQAQARIGASWFFARNVELALYGTGGYVWQPGEDAGTYGLDLEIRWHFLARDEWSLFASVGGGVMGSTSPVPDGGSPFNFTPSVGGGATLEVAENTRLYVSARWYHVSNGGTYANNPGRNGLGLWIGLSVGM